MMGRVGQALPPRQRWRPERGVASLLIVASPLIVPSLHYGVRSTILYEALHCIHVYSNIHCIAAASSRSYSATVNSLMRVTQWLASSCHGLKDSCAANQCTGAVHAIKPARPQATVCALHIGRVWRYGGVIDCMPGYECTHEDLTA